MEEGDEVGVEFAGLRLRHLCSSGSEASLEGIEGDRSSKESSVISVREASEKRRKSASSKVSQSIKAGVWAYPYATAPMHTTVEGELASAKEGRRRAVERAKTH